MNVEDTKNLDMIIEKLSNTSLTWEDFVEIYPQVCDILSSNGRFMEMYKFQGYCYILMHHWNSASSSFLDFLKAMKIY